MLSDQNANGGPKGAKEQALQMEGTAFWAHRRILLAPGPRADSKMWGFPLPLTPLAIPALELHYQTEFCAAHRLFRADWSEQKNQEVFGICANPNGHGHNYFLRVSVRGEIQAETGMVMNFLELQELVAEQILKWVDHRNLDKDVPFLQGCISTAENLLQIFWQRLAPHLPAGVELAALELRESRDFSCTYTGPKNA